MSAKAKMHPATPHIPFCLSRPNEPLWFQKIADTIGESSIVYVAFNEYLSYSKLWKRIKVLSFYVRQNKIQPLIIDLRYNSGGDFNKVRRVFIPAIHRIPEISKPDHVYVLTGPTTFSAVMTNAIDFRNKLDATLVGEPTGSRANQYQEKGKRFVLPNSRFNRSY